MVSVNKTNGTFQVVANNEVTPVTGITNGQVYTVTPGTGATYGVAAGTPTAPTGYSFTSINNIGPGQTISFAPGTVTGTNVATNSILLTNGMLSGNVSGVSGNNITINGLNGMYTGAGTTTITAYGGTNTTYLRCYRRVRAGHGQPGKPGRHAILQRDHSGLCYRTGRLRVRTLRASSEERSGAR